MNKPTGADRTGSSIMEESTYCIIRFHCDQCHEDNRKILYRGLTLEEAQTHCSQEWSREESSQGVVWFEGYEEE